LIINLDFNDLGYLLITRSVLISILKGLNHLEHVYFMNGYETFENYNTSNQLFPMSIKSLFISDYYVIYESNDYIHIYETIGASYRSLNSLTIISNRMLQI
jgi:hypothetical protein